MAHDPLVTIAIPAYQAERTVGGAISSALTQIYPHKEIIVCDDGSTDSTSAIAHAYGSQVTVVNQDNAGVAAARNAAINAGRGDLIVPLDADDLWFPRYVSQLVDMWKKNGGGRRLIASTAFFLTDAGINTRRRIITKKIPRHQLRKRALEGPFMPIFALYPRALHDELGGFDTTLRTAEDYDFWLRAVFHEWHVDFQLEPHACYRRAGHSLSSNITQMMHDEQGVLKRLLHDPLIRLTDEERAYINARLATEQPLKLIQRGEQAVKEGRRIDAAQAFQEAAHIWPSHTGLRRKAWLLQIPGSTQVLSRLQDRRHRET
ncbi:Undecaprenyl-phosphate 4-deoxy-4-formamido-L-arabinose transferase [Austwickia sp. TVS 96-490-7B]|uniref:glycosyltransferase family 2 protein n=1 Tax=Austwickia sp. TVS 96-490-7B TaxID=2830843 RepID=UPI001C570696|nr:glycosyltransferase [Austwickia sp. TVS 96-490-7B]MBW3084566.1 Undecaprenyl-phosphate 4-deoxy-4-formamido-L-arabinose transferase [Austwickia sp. TVS 96-490-7B]